MSYSVLACGSNGNFQLGTNDNQDYDTLQQIELPEGARASNVAKFAFGGNHTFLLLEDGQLFSCGSNNYGQCGFDDTQTVKKFRQVPGKWKGISAGWEYSHLYSYDNVLYACGHGPKGELGLGPHVQTAAQLQEVKGLDPCVEISAIELSINHVIAILADGSLYGWGAARKNQLGHFGSVVNKKGQLKPLQLIWEPKRLDITSRNVCLGRERTLLVNDTLKVIGKDPQTVDIRAEKAGAMWSSMHYSHWVEDELVISSFGNNSHGQLYKYKAPTQIVDFEVGSEHGVVLLKDGSVYAWGWGEHGNCGVARNNSVTFDFLNLIYNGNDEVITMACGLATTWLVVKAATHD